MTTTDMGIAYNAKLKEIQSTILKLEKMSIDMTDIKKAIERIEQEVSSKVQASYHSFGNSTPTAFLYDSLTEDYRKAIKELDMMNDALKKEWESYYQIEQSYKKIQESLKNVNKDNIKMIALAVRETLQSLKSSTTIDYQLEKDLVDKVYRQVYQVMQLELLYSNESLLFDYVKANSIDSPFIVDLIKKDLTEVKEESAQIKQLVLQLTQKGLDERYLLDKNLLTVIALYKNPNLEAENKKQFISAVDDYIIAKEESMKQKQEVDHQEKDLSELLLDDYQTKKKRNSRRIVVLLNTIIVSAGILAGIFVGRELAKGKDYQTTTSIYNSITGETTSTKEYLPGKYGSIQLIEYSPWDNPGAFRKNYRRNVYKYAVPQDMDSSTLQEYLEENHQGTINYDTSEQTSEEQPEDYGYTENKYVITEVAKDLEDFQIKDRGGLWALFSFIIAGGILTVDLALFKGLSKTSLRLIRETKEELKEEIKERRIDHNEAMEELRKLVSEEEKKMQKLRYYYDSLPDAMKQLPEVEEAKQKLLQKKQ